MPASTASSELWDQIDDQQQLQVQRQGPSEDDESRTTGGQSHRELDESQIKRNSSGDSRKEGNEKACNPQVVDLALYRGVEHLQERARACYKEAIPRNGTEPIPEPERLEFIERMNLNGSFVIEMLLCSNEGFEKNGYNEDDPVILNAMLNSIQQPMIKMENQIPLCPGCNYGISPRPQNQDRLLFLDIKFKKGISRTLQIPHLEINDGTKSLRLNLIAIEQRRPGRSHPFTSYVNLIRSPEDVALLRTHGIIEHRIGSDDEVIKLLHSLSKEVGYYQESCYLKNCRRK
ncbi:hypothetical protein CJ030_MR5G009727 [Morella rubra]|uniref:Uncharacterized protein n=1 Tax=Morella rubra TaxID=262757 RepID=A0A6A1VJA3_9ROSI|nr:hypothetical protein CJ030_MR5G009727 [Morella rubra]